MQCNSIVYKYHHCLERSIYSCICGMKILSIFFISFITMVAKIKLSRHFWFWFHIKARLTPMDINRDKHVN